MVARLLFIGLWNFCDDGGNHPASLKTLKAEVFPGDEITSSEVCVLVDELLTTGLLMEYEVAGKRYWHVTGWRHQKIEKPNFKHPKPLQESSSRRFDDKSSIDPMPTDDPSPPEGRGEEGRGNGMDTPPLVPPEGGGPACSAKRREARQQKTFADWCEEVKAKGEKFISDYAPIWDYAAKVGLPQDFVMLAFQVFKDRYLNTEKCRRKRYRDWRLAFLNCIKADWFHLWRADLDGRYVLSSAGVQADLEHRRAA